MDQHTDRQELWDEYVTERLSRILEHVNPAARNEADSFWNQASAETRTQIEAWESVQVEWEAERNKEIYRAAFSDGLYLGAAVFWREQKEGEKT